MQELGLEDETEAVSLEEAVSQGRMLRCRFDKWFIDRGFGFATVHGKTIFVHSSVEQKTEYVRKDLLTMLRVGLDPSRDGVQFKVAEAQTHEDWQLEQAAQAAQKSADQARRAAEITVRASERVYQRLQTVRLSTP